MTFAPILTTFSRSVVSDHRSTSSGKTRVRRWLGFKQSILDPIARVLRGVGSGMFARTPASPPCSCPLRLSPSGKTVDPEAPLPASPVCDRDSTRRFHGAHSRLIRLLHSSLRPHALLPQD